MVRLSREDIGYLIFALWLGAFSAKALIFPDPVGDFPFIGWPPKVCFLIGAVLEVSHRLGRRRWERVRVYNTLLNSGPTEFSLMLRKRPLVPRWYRGTINAKLDDEGVTTCPSGHPVAGSLVRVVSDSRLLGKLVCAPCGATLPRPPAVDVDEATAIVKAKLEHQRKKKEKRARRAATPTGGPSS
jgi:hypothetical protein